MSDEETKRALFEALARVPGEFDFFQALRRIETAHPEMPRLGEAARPADEPMRLGQEPSLAFPPASLASARAAEGDRAARIAVRFFGLFGPNGPLPLHLTEHAREQIRDENDPGFARFADIFHHRFLTLFYRAWASAEPVRMRDRPADDQFAQQLAALLGLALPTYNDRNLISDQMKLFFAGRFAMPTRNAEGLQALLVADLGVPVRIEEFVGGWITIPVSARWRLGPGKQAGRLGQTAILGQRAWQCDQKFRVVVGPVGAGSYDEFLPGGPGV
ncbi:MAG TPA: type VI secretion system baseplate subunit TssG, partial [Polyangia bacterium]